MSDQIDSAIKLFGKMIPLKKPSHDHHHHHTSYSPPTLSLDHHLVNGSGKQGKETPQMDGRTREDHNHEGRTSNSKDPTTSSGDSENPKTSSGDRETSSRKSSKRGGEQSDTSCSQEKPLKKPDKILPCPRCNSMETKFCYYNNYNVNQPRHFCKNCQRYWTAGGSMRNVPVGAGRRKSKNSSDSNHHDITVSEALLAAQASSANGLVYGGHILTFGSESPLRESVASVLNLSQKAQPCIQNVGIGGGGAVRDDQNVGSGTAASKHFLGFPQACLPATPWPYSWNSAVPMPSPPAFCPPGFPVTFYPTAAYWGYNVVPPCNIPTSPTLGKHSRDENSWRESNSVKEQCTRQSNHSERHVLVPKTLRIDDPDEAAKSSIWATLGISSNKTSTGTLFNRFQSKSNERSNHMSEAPSVLQANPAALSRSVKFHEST